MMSFARWLHLSTHHVKQAGAWFAWRLAGGLRRPPRYRRPAWQSYRPGWHWQDMGLEERVFTGGGCLSAGLALGAGAVLLAEGRSLTGPLGVQQPATAPVRNADVALLAECGPGNGRPSDAFFAGLHDADGEAAENLWSVRRSIGAESDIAAPGQGPTAFGETGSDTPPLAVGAGLDEPVIADPFGPTDLGPSAAPTGPADPGGGGAALGGGGGAGGGAAVANPAPASTPALPQAGAPVAIGGSSAAASASLPGQAAVVSPAVGPRIGTSPSAGRAPALMPRLLPMDGPGGPGNGSYFEYTAVEGAVPTAEVIAQFTDYGSGPYQVSIDWGDGSGTSSGTVTLASAGFPNTYDVSGSHTYIEEGAYGISITVSGLQGGQTIHLSSVGNINDAALTSDPYPLRVVEDKPYTGVVAAFVDTNPYATAADFTVPPPWQVVADSRPGIFYIVGTDKWTEEGSYQLRIPVTDDGGSTITAVASVTVTDAPISLMPGDPNHPIQWTEGVTQWAGITTLTDTAPDDTTATFTASVGSELTGQSFQTRVVPLGGGRYEIDALLDYHEELGAEDTLLVGAADDGGSEASTVNYVWVGDAALSWVGGSPNFTWTQTLEKSPVVIAPPDQTNAEGDNVRLPIQASDPDGDALHYDAVGLPKGLAIDLNTGIISGSVDYSAAEFFGGQYPITVVVTDGKGGNASASFNWNITDTPQPPVLTSPGDQANVRGDTVNLQINASSPDGSQLIYDASNLPPGLSIDSLTGEITGTIDPTQDYTSPYAVTLTVSDGTFTETQSFHWSLTNGNQAPVLTSPGDQVNAGGDTVEVDLSAADADQDTLTYFASGLPAGLSLDPATGVISGTINPAAASATPYTVTVSASDGMVKSSQTFAWTVNFVGLQSPGDQANITGDTVSLPVTATSATGTSLSYSATGLPAGLGIDSTTGLISGTISVTADAASPYTVTVTASDGSHSAGTTFAWAVAHLALANPGDQTSVEGASVSLAIQASDADGDSLAYTATGLPAGLAIDPHTGVISGTPAAGSQLSGPYHITVAVSDGPHTASTGFTWAVTPAIVLIPPGGQANLVGDSVSLQVHARNALGGLLGYVVHGLPPGLSIDPLSGLISGTVGGSSGASYAVTVVATDGNNYACSTTFTWAVPPLLLTDPGEQDNTTGDTISLPVSARAAAGLMLSYSASGLPSNLTIDPNTGIISGTIAATADCDSPYSVTVTASAGGASASQDFTWYVDPHITFNTGASDQANGTGDAVSLDVSASDADGDVLSYTAGGLPAGLAIDPTTGFISGTIAAGADTSSPYTVTVTASDGSRSSSESFNWNVAHIGLVNPGDPWSAAGQTVSLALQAHDADGDALTYTATGLPPGLSISSSTGLISGTLTSTADAHSPYTVTVTASDGSESSSQTFVWTVTEVGVTNPGDQANTEGDTVSLQVTATSGAGQALTYSASSLPPGLTINPATGLISGTLTPGAADGGPYTVTVAASDGSQGMSQAFTWMVNPRVVFANRPADQTNSEGDSVSLSVPATDTAGLTLTYAADGLPPGVTINPTTGVISGTIAAGASASGPYVAVVSATDGTYADSVAFGWNIPHAEGAGPALGNPGPQAGTESDPVFLPVTASDPDGDPLTFSAAGLPAGLSIDPYSGVISGTMDGRAAAQGPYTITVSVDDGNGGTASQTFLWTAQPAVLTAQGVDVSGEEGNATGEVPVATFTDPNWLLTSGDFTATIDWGDGTGSDVGDVSGAAGSFTVGGDHTYARPGSYTVTASIADGEAAAAIVTSAATVVEAPLTVAAGLKLTAVVNRPDQFTVGVLTDANPGQDPAGYTVQINWHDGVLGDGSDWTTGSLVEQVDGTFLIVGTHTFIGEGDFPVTAMVSDAEGTQVVSPPLPQPQTVVEVGDYIPGQPIGLTVSAFQDANPYASVGDYTAVISWGDGTTSVGLVGGSAAAGFTVSGSHQYALPGAYQASVHIEDDGGSTLDGGGLVTLIRAPVTMCPGVVPDPCGAPTGRLEVADFTSLSPLDVPANFTLSSAPDAGTDGGGSIQQPCPDLFQAFGSYTYAQQGLWPALTMLDWSAGGAPDAEIGCADPPGEQLFAGKLKITGPTVVPGNSWYTYYYRFPTLVPENDVHLGTWSFSVSQGPPDTASKRSSGWLISTTQPGMATGVFVEVNFLNHPAVLTIKGTGFTIKDAPLQIPDIKDIVVVEVGKPDGTGGLATPARPDAARLMNGVEYPLSVRSGKPGPVQWRGQQAPGEPGSLPLSAGREAAKKEWAFPVYSSLWGSKGGEDAAPAVRLTAAFSLIAPPGHAEAIQDIAAGFIQTVSVSGSAQYPFPNGDKGIRTVSNQAPFALDWDVGKPSTWPWVGLKTPSLAARPSQKTSVYLELMDAPRALIPVFWNPNQKGVQIGLSPFAQLTQGQEVMKFTTYIGVSPKNEKSIEGFFDEGSLGWQLTLNCWRKPTSSDGFSPNGGASQEIAPLGKSRSWSPAPATPTTLPVDAIWGNMTVIGNTYGIAPWMSWDPTIRKTQ